MSRVHLIKRTITQPHPIPLEFILDYSFLSYCNNVPCNVLQNYCNIWTKNGNHDLRTWWDMHCIYPNAPMVYNASKAHINFHLNLVSLYAYSEILCLYVYMSMGFCDKLFEWMRKSLDKKCETRVGWYFQSKYHYS